MKTLKNKQGGSYITTCVVVLVIAMILSIVLFYASTMTIVETTRENTEMVLDSFIMKNSIEIYNSIKQGHDFTEMFDENYYLSEYSERFLLDLSENSLYNVADSEIIYIITNPDVTYQVENSLQLKVDYTVQIPVKFAGKTLYMLEIPMTVTSSLTLKN